MNDVAPVIAIQSPGRATPTPWPAGAWVALLILALIAVSLAALLTATGTPAAIEWGYLAGLLRFTALQAGLSTLLSLALGASLALALARRHLPGRGAVLAVLGAVTALPAIVVVFAVTAVYGRAGLANQALSGAGLPTFSIYGLAGILVAHVVFNAAFSTRVFLSALEAVPGEHWRLAQALGMPPLAVFRLIDWPVLRGEMPSLALLTFLVCATSFAIPLALGGGPGAATLEVAIYEALRFDADFGRTALLALVQIVLLAALVLMSLPWLRRPLETPGLGRRIERPDREGGLLVAWDALVLLGATLLILPVLAMVFWGGRGAPALLNAAVLRALLTSLAVALPAACLSLAAALMLVRARGLLAGAGAKGASLLLSGVPLLALGTPPVALAAGLYVLARRFGEPAAAALPVLVLINALMALPFVTRFVEAPLLVAEARYGWLAASLGLGWLDRLRFVEAPLLAGPAAAALAYATALSLGDLGVVTLFGSDALVTLPALLYERLGSYRIDEAAGLSALLAALVLGLFAVAARAGRGAQPPGEGPHAGRA